MLWAFALRQSEGLTKVFDKGLTLVTSALETLYVVQFTSSTQLKLVKPNYLVLPTTDAAPQFLWEVTHFNKRKSFDLVLWSYFPTKSSLSTRVLSGVKSHYYTVILGGFCRGLEKSNTITVLDTIENHCKMNLGFFSSLKKKKLRNSLSYKFLRWDSY